LREKKIAKQTQWNFCLQHSAGETNPDQTQTNPIFQLPGVLVDDSEQ
jgi:hypothetical protein